MLQIVKIQQVLLPLFGVVRFHKLICQAYHLAYRRIHPAQSGKHLVFRCKKEIFFQFFDGFFDRTARIFPPFQLFFTAFIPSFRRQPVKCKLLQLFRYAFIIRLFCRPG